MFVVRGPSVGVSGVRVHLDRLGHGARGLEDGSMSEQASESVYRGSRYQRARQVGSAIGSPIPRLFNLGNRRGNRLHKFR